MNGQMIIFGSGLTGKDALDFFTPQTVFCFVDSNLHRKVKAFCGKPVISPAELPGVYSSPAQGVCFDVVLASRDIWSVFAMANQLEKMGIHDYSTYLDIRRRWRSGKAFAERDRTLVPCEQELLLGIYRRQFDYLRRHADPLHLRPATGSLREIQMQKIGLTVKFLEQVKMLDIKPFMIGGTLIGSLRHQGFIPWDDDIDFGIMYGDYRRLLEYCQANLSVYRDTGNNVWKRQDGSTAWEDATSPFVVTVRRGYMQLYLNTEKYPLPNRVCLADFFPVYYIDDKITKDAYAEMLAYWDGRRSADYYDVERNYCDEIKDLQIFVDHSTQCARGFDCVSALNHFFRNSGKHYTVNMWPEDAILPLKKLPFEGYELWAPNDPEQWFEGQQLKSPMRIPGDIGIPSHQKSSLFTEQY